MPLHAAYSTSCKRLLCPRGAFAKAEDLAQLGRNVPGAEDVVDADDLRAYPPSGSPSLFLGWQDDFGDVSLNVVEGGQQHVLRLHAIRFDVAVAYELEGRIDRLQAGQIVRALLAGSLPRARS